MKIEEITINDKAYDETIELRANVISIPFGFPLPKKERETLDSHFFIAKDDNDKVIGFAMITPSSDKKSIRARQVSVILPLQKKGIGRLLMHAIEQKTVELGYSELRLYAHTGSYPFFLKLNYKEQGDWETQDNGLKTIFMAKALQ